MALAYMVLSVLLVCTRLSRSQQQEPTLVFTLRDSYSVDPSFISRLQPCIFSGSPTPVVTWTYNSKELPTSADSGGVYYQPENGTLILDRAGSGNNGVYECTGTNSLGMKSASTKLVFIRPTILWYASWYMWFVYAIVLWVLSIFVFIAWFLYVKKRAFSELPPPNDWIGT